MRSEDMPMYHDVIALAVSARDKGWKFKVTTNGETIWLALAAPPPPDTTTHSAKEDGA